MRGHAFEAGEEERRLRAAIGLSESLARRGSVAQAIDGLWSSWRSTSPSAVGPVVVAEACALLADHALLIGDVDLAAEVLGAAGHAVGMHREPPVAAPLAIGAERLRAAIGDEGRGESGRLGGIPALRDVLPTLRRGTLLARALHARAELRLDCQDATGAAEDARAASLLWTREGGHDVERAIARRVQAEALLVLGDSEAARELLTAALQVFTADALDLEAAETRHALAEVALRAGHATPAEQGDSTVDDLIATLIFLDALRSQFSSEGQRMHWARHIVEPVLALSLEVAIAAHDGELIADLIATVRSVGVPTVRPALTIRGAYRTPVGLAHENGIDTGAAIAPARGRPTMELTRSPASPPVMPGGRIALQGHRTRAGELYPSILRLHDGARRAHSV